MNEIERRERLIQWIEIIFAEIEDLFVDNHIFWRLQDVVRDNPQFRECSGLFTQWIASNFAEAAAVGIRRQAKMDTDSVSLKRFLNEVCQYPTMVSRDYYMSLFEGYDSWLIEINQRHFDSFAGKNGTHIPKAVAEEQLRCLTEAVKGIEHYVDRRVAHYDKRGLGQALPKFGDITLSLHTIEKIVLFYWRCLKGGSSGSILPVLHPEWENIFQFAWNGS